MSEFSFICHASATAFLFPGQGSQHVGMLQELVDTYSVAKRAMEEADDVLGFALSRLCFDGPEAVLTDTVNAQPALVAASVAILRAIESELEEDGPVTARPGTVLLAGHSLGEYSALVAAGGLTYADGLRLVHARGRLMKEAGVQTPGMMAAVLGLDEATVTTICGEATAQCGIAQVANDNCPGQVVISGDRPGMEAAMAALAAAGARRIVPLAVSIGAHSPLMQPAAAILRSIIDATPIAAPAVPVIANTNAQPLTTVDAIRAELAAQLTGRVRWADSMHYALNAGVTHFVEIGPGDVLAGLIRRIDRTAQRRTVNTPEGVCAFVQQLKLQR